jgi:hypothetical protein
MAQYDSRRGSTRTPSHDDVARRAYELFQARGGEPGHELENWLDAERELKRPLLSEAHLQERPSRRKR